MLVIANGAPKSGSTWLFNIIRNMHEFADVPENYLLDRANPNSEIVYERLEEFLSEIDYVNNDYLLKNHFGEPAQRDAILGAKNCLVVNIKRDLKDVVVSAYYYNMKLKERERTFKEYYWNEGRFLADHVRRYHQNWEQFPSSRVLTVSYERLVEHTLSEVVGIARFLGFDSSPAAAEAVIEATSMEKLRKRYNDEGEIKFFRKGQVGDWKNHFQSGELSDINLISDCGLRNSSLGRRVLAKSMSISSSLNSRTASPS